MINYIVLIITLCVVVKYLHMLNVLSFSKHLQLWTSVKTKICLIQQTRHNIINMTFCSTSMVSKTWVGLATLLDYLSPFLCNYNYLISGLCTYFFSICGFRTSTLYVIDSSDLGSVNAQDADWLTSIPRRWEVSLFPLHRFFSNCSSTFTCLPLQYPRPCSP